MEPPESFVEVVNLTGDSNGEAGNDGEAGNLNDTGEAPAAYDGDQGIKAPSIDEITADATIVHSCVPPVHRTELVSHEPGMSSSASTELASPVPQRVIWQEPIRGRLEHGKTGYMDYLHLVIFPLEDGHDFPGEVHDSLWRHSNKFLTITALGERADSIPNFSIQPAESHSNRNTSAPSGTISPSSLSLSTDPAAGSAHVSVGPVVLPPDDYSSPGGCRSTRLSLRVARCALEVRASEMGRSRRCAFPLPENQDGSHFVGDIDLPADYDYDSVENCRRVASWLWLAESMMKQREDTLCRGDSVPPVGSTDDIDLGVSEQIFGEPKPQETGSVQKNKRKRRAQEPVGVQSRKRPRCGERVDGRPSD